MAERGTRFSDDELLGLLARSMAPAALQPTGEGVCEVRMLAARRQRDELRPARVPAPGAWRRRLAGVGVVAGAVVLGSGTAFAAGVPVPDPLRSLAVDVGLPVTPVAVVHVQDATAALDDDLRAGSGLGAPATARDAATLASELARLGPGDRARVSARPEHVLAQACAALGGGGAPAAGSEGSAFARFCRGGIRSGEPGAANAGGPGAGAAGGAGGGSPSGPGGVPGGTRTGGGQGPGTGPGAGSGTGGQSPGGPRGGAGPGSGIGGSGGTGGSGGPGGGPRPGSGVGSGSRLGSGPSGSTGGSPGR